MRQPFVRWYWGLGLAVIPVVFAVVALRAPQPTPAITTAPAFEEAPRTLPSATLPPPSPQPQFIAAAAEQAPEPTATALPTATLPPTVTPTPNPNATPTPRPAGTPRRVGIQVGHWKQNELPEELARLRGSSGAFAGGVSEMSVNLDVAQRVVTLLENQGIIVDLLPATVPVDYDADAFVSIHADGSSSTGAHGFKMATPWRTSRAGQHLIDVMREEYATATGMPWDNAITVNMRGYYAFNYRRHDHATARTTPSVIIEMGFLTNAGDRAFMLNQPDRIATAIANGILRYLNEHDYSDGGSLLAPEYKQQRSLSPDGVDVRTEPRDDAPVLARAPADQRFNPLQERDGWFQVFVRRGEQRLIGWVRKDLLVETNDPTPTPLPATDS